MSFDWFLFSARSVYLKSSVNIHLLIILSYRKLYIMLNNPTQIHNWLWGIKKDNKKVDPWHYRRIQNWSPFVSTWSRCPDNGDQRLVIPIYMHETRQLRNPWQEIYFCLRQISRVKFIYAVLWNMWITKLWSPLSQHLDHVETNGDQFWILR